jgi:hypothetical protein
MPDQNSFYCIIYRSPCCDEVQGHGYLQGSENGRVVTIEINSNNTVTSIGTIAG